MPDKKTRQSIDKFLKSQKLLDMNLTLGELSRKLGDDAGTLAGYTFAWDKYVYDVADVASDVIQPGVAKGAVTERRQRALEILDTNIKVNDLMKLTVDSGIDEVAGYVYTEDKNTFIVASLMDEQIMR